MGEVVSQVVAWHNPVPGKVVTDEIAGIEQ
jgi:hypothetical protein